MNKTHFAKQKEMAGCSDCGAFVHKIKLRNGYNLSCPLCGAVLAKAKNNSINKTLAFSFSGLILFIPTCFLPVLKLNILGISGDCTMLKGVIQMFGNGFWWMSFIVFFCSVLAPLAVFLLLLFISASVKFNYYTRTLKKALKLYQILNKWIMLDVYMLGILIAYIKMKEFGDLSAGVGLYCFIGVLLIANLTTMIFDRRLVWEKIEEFTSIISPAVSDNTRCVLCMTCGRLCHKKISSDGLIYLCPRCNSKLYNRKPFSIKRTLAFVITGFLLLIPANLCPITYIVYHGFGEPDTILSGISCLIRDDMIPIAILVFIASVIVPIFKLMGLLFLLATIHFKWKVDTLQSTLMYRFISIIGRWSMLDLFILSILVALVDMGAVSSIVPGVGATAFASVVVITLFASMNFDPRMLWDIEESK